MADGFNTEDMLDMYLLENQQLLERLQDIVLEQKDEECFDEDAINEIFRTMHTIKASSGVMMFDNITKVSHKLEDIFYVLREDNPENVPHLQLVEHVLDVADFITAELDKIQNGEAVDEDSGDIMERLDVFLKDIKREDGAATTKKEQQNDSSQKFYIAPRKSIKHRYDMQSMDVFEVVAEESPQIIIDLESSVEEIEARAEQYSKVFVPGDFVLQAKEPGKAKRLAKDKRNVEQTSYIHVDIAKMDKLMKLIDELVVSQSVVLQNPDLKVPGLEQMVKISTDLQNIVRSMRMVSLENTFQKMNRIVFDISRKLGKDIEFAMVGERTEVDKNIAEHISDSLMHLVRNAIDHGIETPEEKAAAGKMQRSRIILSAKIESGKVWITVEDNGRGLDRVKIMNKARKQGLIDYSRPESTYTDEEIFRLITLPGFSTKEEITEYSGRGVGMDVVVSNIASIGGSLEIESKKGEWSRIIMKVPH